MMSIQTVGRYVITVKLGRGAMGVVYKALDTTIWRTVALKTMRLDVHGLDAQEMVRRFQNEARAAGVLNHPNIVTIYDAGEQDGIFYIAMEFIEGTTLHEVLAEQRVLATDEVLQLTRQICRGLDYAHSNGIVHRDIKPANIMITGNGTVKIMDFGIAKSGGQVTNTGQVLGTPNYMAPEQVKGRQLDGRSDLFSLGVILYEMLTGEKPFVGQNVTTIIYKIVNENPTSPRDLDVTVHPGLSAVVIKALAKSPDDRYQTGAELMNDLEKYKSLGSSLAVTAVVSTSTVAGLSDPSEQTLVLPASTAVAAMAATQVVNGSSAAAAAPAKVAGPPKAIEKPGTTVIENHKIRLYIGAVAAVLVLAVGVAGYGYYERRTAQKLADRAEAQVQLDKTIKASTPRVAVPPPVPDPTPEPETQTGQPIQDKSKVKPVRVRASSSPNQVFNHQAELKISSTPDGAKVELDGWSEPKWVTPFTASNVAAGKHNVVVTRPGYMQEERDVEVAAGKTLAVDIALNPVPPKVVVSSTPQGANIVIDGKDIGKTTPSEITSLQKGPHTVLLRKQGFKDVSTSETLADGQIFTYSPVLLANSPTIAQKQDAQKQDDGKGPGFWKRVFGVKGMPEGKGMVHVRTNP